MSISDLFEKIDALTTKVDTLQTKLNKELSSVGSFLGVPYIQQLVAEIMVYALNKKTIYHPTRYFVEKSDAYYREIVRTVLHEIPDPDMGATIDRILNTRHEEAHCSTLMILKERVNNVRCYLEQRPSVRCECWEVEMKSLDRFEQFFDNDFSGSKTNTEFEINVPVDRRNEIVTSLE